MKWFDKLTVLSEVGGDMNSPVQIRQAFDVFVELPD